MSQTLKLPDEVYRKLAQGAADRGMTTESLLTVVADLVVLPDRPTKQDRQRSQRIELLLERFRAGKLDATDRDELDLLIDADYAAANAAADQLIRAKKSRTTHQLRDKPRG